jgi:Na+/melibiose symporter-like transporter
MWSFSLGGKALMFRVLRNRTAVLYLSGFTLSSVGSNTLFLATGIWVMSLTGSSAAAGATVFFIMAPSLFAPLLGVLVDRMERTKALAWTNLLLAFALLPLLAVDRAADVWVIYAVSAVYGLGVVVTMAAQGALLPMLVADDELAAANSYLSLVRSLSRLGGPLLGAGIFAVHGADLVVLVAGACFLLATVPLLMVRIPEDAPPKHHAADPWRVAVAAGLRFLRRTPEVRRVVGATAAAFAMGGLFEAVVFEVVAELKHEPAFLGVLVSVQGAGAIVVAFLVPLLIQRLGEAWTVCAGLLAAAVALGLLLVPSPAAALLAMLVLGAGVAAAMIGMNTLVQRRTPNEMLARVGSAAQTAVFVPQTAFIALGAALVAIIDHKVLLIVMVAVTAAGALTLVRPGMTALPTSQRSRAVEQWEP